MSGEKLVEARVQIGLGGQKLSLKLKIPTAEIPPEALLPGLQELTNHVMGTVESKVDRVDGVEISCKKGCGACCRQYVPISPPEARMLAAIVESYPREKRIAMKKRFHRAALKLQDAGLLNKAMNYSGESEEEARKLVHDYFNLGIACPFLEEESCSIHLDRPLICREYLVISDPRHCATMSEDDIKRLDVPVSISDKFASMEGVGKEGHNRFMPLIMALEWVERYPDDASFRPGPDWIKEFFSGLSESETIIDGQPEGAPETGGESPSPAA